MGDRLGRLRASVGAAASRVYPGLDEALWTAGRNREIRRARAARPAVPPGRAPVDPPDGVISLLIVATGNGDTSDRWRPGAGNHFFEVAQSAIDLLGAQRVHVMHVAAGEDPLAWHQRVYARAREVSASHILGNVETDPFDMEQWSWDVFLDGLRHHWHGVFLGLMYDSANEWTTIRANRLVVRDDRTLLIALDRPLAGVLPGSLAHVGPVILPISQPSQALILDAVADQPKEFDVSFIGALYDYRVPVLDGMVAAGVPVTVNPQRPDVTRTYEESRSAQPDYLDYMRALARSHITLNLSRAHTEETQQLKTRILEGSFAGCVVATDDRDRSDHYFTAGEEFLRFSGVSGAAAVIRDVLADPDRLARIQAAATERARAIAGSVFWAAVDAGLRSSSLPAVLPDSTRAAA